MPAWLTGSEPTSLQRVDPVENTLDEDDDSNGADIANGCGECDSSADCGADEYCWFGEDGYDCGSCEPNNPTEIANGCGECDSSADCGADEYCWFGEDGYDCGSCEPNNPSY